MSKYTFIDVETALNASESTPRSKLPWHSVFRQTKSNKEHYARLVGDNYSQFGGVGNKTYNPDNISACGAKWSDPTTDTASENCLCKYLQLYYRARYFVERQCWKY